MDENRLVGDCARCAALCCVMLAFDRSEDFAFDKGAGTPCVHLNGAHTCAIHAERDACGFGGCTRYDCAGAGQRVTHEAFGGRSWRDDRSLVRPMLEAFRAMREVQELWLLLRSARALSLTPSQVARLDALERALDAERTWSCEALSAFERSGLAKDVRAFFASLRHTLSRPPENRRLPICAR